MRKITIIEKTTNKTILDVSCVVDYQITNYNDSTDVEVTTVDNVKYTVSLKDEFKYKIIID